MAPTRVDISVGGDDLVRRNAEQTKAKRFAAVDQRFFDGVQNDAIAARKVAAAEAGVDAKGNPLNDKAKDLQRLDDEPAANRRTGLLYVCMGYAEHPDQAVWQPWLERIAKRGFKNYTFVYLQLEPQPSSYRPHEVLFKPYHSDLGFYELANEFDRVSRETSTGPGRVVPAVKVDLPRWWTLTNQAYARQVVTTETGSFTEFWGVNITGSGTVLKQPASLTYTLLRPFADVLPQNQRQGMRLGTFNYKAKGASLLQTLKTVTGLPLQKFKRVVFDVHPLYRDHQLASYDNSGVLYQQAAINLLPFLAEVGSHLRNAGYRMDNSLGLGSASSPAWNGYVNPFEFQGVTLPTDERQNIIDEGVASDFHEAWRPDPFDPFLPIAPARELDPLVDYRASLLNGNSAEAVVPPLDRLSNFLDGLGNPAWRSSKSAFLMDAGTFTAGGSYQYPQSYKGANVDMTTARAKERRYTIPSHNPLLRLYVVLDALSAYGIL